MLRKPLIGINTEFRAAQNDQSAYSYLWAGYYDGILHSGGIPVVLPPLSEEEDVARVLDTLDGFVLTGGPDLDPERDGFLRHPTVRPMAPRRETFDRMLVNQIIERRMPVFGIGLGMQLLNVASGGTLFYHIPEDCPSALPHKDLQDKSHRHGLEVVMGSLMENIYGDGEIRVNSSHHMAIDDVAPGFMATAQCPDGVTEAIESTTDDWLAFGCQFHPESDSASAIDMRLFEEFLFGITGEVFQLRAVA